MSFGLAAALDVILAAGLLAKRVEIQDSQNSVAGAPWAKEIEIVGAICRASELAAFNVF